MAIQVGNSEQDQQKSKGKGLATLLGLITGGPVGAAEALVSQSNPAVGKAVSLASGAGGGTQTDPTDAISRKVDAGPQLTPDQHIQAGLEALNHPDTPSHVAMMAAPILLQAKHFQGPHPMGEDAIYGSQDSNPNNDQSY